MQHEIKYIYIYIKFCFVLKIGVVQDSEYIYLANTYLAPVFELLFKDAVQI